MTTRPEPTSSVHTSRLVALLAPLASIVLPGSGQMLQGRFAVGLRHAALALLLVAVGVPTIALVSGPALCILGCWSAYDAWRARRSAGPTPAAACGSAGGSGGASGEHGSAVDMAVLARTVATAGPPMAWWRRILRVAPLVALQMVAAGEIMFLLVAAALSVMAFDAPGSTSRLDLWAFVVGMNLLPWVAAFLCAFAWGLHARGRTVWAGTLLATVVLACLAVARLLLGPQRLW